MSSQKQQETKILKLSLVPPVLEEKNILGAKVGFRPQRQGGFRNEREVYENQIIYHNYGYGGGGVSLSYGVAELTRQRSESDIAALKTKKVAVLGSGYIGLLIALKLTSTCQVTIYSSQFPSKQKFSTDQNSLITSQVAGGYFMPYGYIVGDSEQAKLYHKQATELSHNYFQTIVDKKLYQGVKLMPVIHIDEPDYFDTYMPPGTLSRPQKAQVTWGNGKYFDAQVFDSYMIEGDIFLLELKRQCEKKGIKFVQKKFTQKEELLALDESIIFNCMSDGSKEVFGDDKLYQSKGQLLFIQPTKGLNYYLSANAPNGQRLTLYPHTDKMGIGITRQDNYTDQKVSEAQNQQFLTNAKEFFQDQIVSPQL